MNVQDRRWLEKIEAAIKEDREATAALASQIHDIAVRAFGNGERSGSMIDRIEKNEERGERIEARVIAVERAALAKAEQQRTEDLLTSRSDRRKFSRRDWLMVIAMSVTALAAVVGLIR